MNPNYNWSPSGKRGALAHEVGHLYGLHERYHHAGPVCNDTELTVMDGATVDAQGRLVHCDSLEGPANTDKVRVTTYWSERFLSSFQAAVDPVNRSVGIWTWKDDAWADNEHYLTFYYWDGVRWVEYHHRFRRADVGVHRLTEDRTHKEVINGTTYNVPGPRYRLACGQPWFEKWYTYGAEVCSRNMVWLY